MGLEAPKTRACSVPVSLTDWDSVLPIKPTDSTRSMALGARMVPHPQRQLDTKKCGSELRWRRSGLCGHTQLPAPTCASLPHCLTVAVAVRGSGLSVLPQLAHRSPETEPQRNTLLTPGTRNRLALCLIPSRRLVRIQNRVNPVLRISVCYESALKEAETAPVNCQSCWLPQS